MKFLSLFLTLFLSVCVHPAFAGSAASESNAKFELNRASQNMLARHKVGDRLTDNVMRVARGSYSFAKQGGGPATVNLLDPYGQPVVLPKGAIIWDCVIDVQTAGTTSASGTMAINLQSAGDIKAALAAASYTGRVACLVLGTAASALKLTADRTLQATIATGALTNGKWDVDLFYTTGN